MDKAGKSYWDSQWQGSELPRALDVEGSGLANHIPRVFHRAFLRVDALRSASGQSLLEIGCARSTWLSYFSKQFGLAVAGLDYSDRGCELTRRILNRDGIPGVVHCRDFQADPGELGNAFDFVISFGVVEHFVPTSQCIKSFARFLRPGGTMITSIPNLAGMNGAIQKVIDRETYDIHVPLDANALGQAHEEAGLCVQQSEYLEFINFGILRFREGAGVRSTLLRKAFSAVTVGAWKIGEKVPLPPNRLTSPYALCVARKPAA